MDTYASQYLFRGKENCFFFYRFPSFLGLIEMLQIINYVICSNGLPYINAFTLALLHWWNQRTTSSAQRHPKTLCLVVHMKNEEWKNRALEKFKPCLLSLWRRKIHVIVWLSLSESCLGNGLTQLPTIVPMERWFQTLFNDLTSTLFETFYWPEFFKTSFQPQKVTNPRSEIQNFNLYKNAINCA